jgi:Domain of unknown function (DUF5069)
MEALDLTTQKPRGPRVKLGGLAFMARTVDKLRAEQPGGKIGVFLNRPDGLSVVLCKRAGIEMDELRGVVASAANESEIAAWIEAKVPAEKRDEINAKLESMSIERLPPEFQAAVRHVHPVMAKRPELSTFFDIFEADDAEV